MSPFATSKNEGIQSKSEGNTKKIEIRRRTDATMSIPLSISPLRINRPLRNKRPAQKSKYCV